MDRSCFAKQGDRAGLDDRVIEYARRNHIESLRLQQDAFNVASLSLYASLGFAFKVSVAVIQAMPALEASVRPVQVKLSPAVSALRPSLVR